MIIQNFDDIKKRFKQINKDVVGIGVTAFNRVGSEDFLPNYKIICLRNSKDNILIRKNAKVLCISKKEGSNLLKRKRNTANILKAKTTKNYINKLGNPHLLLYKYTKSVIKVTDKMGWTNIVGNNLYEMDVKMGKIGFREILEELKLKPIPWKVKFFSKMKYTSMKKLFGNFVVQVPGTSGGKGTFFINSDDDFKKMKEVVKERYGDGRAVVSKFVKGPSPSLTCCVTKHGTLYTNLQYQLLDIPEVLNSDIGSGVFAGHDWESARFPKNIREQAYNYAHKIGEYMRERGYRGIFGIDMLMDQKKKNIYPIECNFRMLGSFPTITMIQSINGEIPFLALHILEFLGEDYQLDYERVNRLSKKHKPGAHLLITNKFNDPVKVWGDVEPGVYSFKNGELVFKRYAYHMRSLKNTDDVLICDGVPYRGAVFNTHQRIMRLITLRSMRDPKTGKLNKWASELTEKVYEKLNLKFT
ncbi:MAG: ATP-grasp domain-containing protein [Candidatus Aenigmarchaeota archaeon]|nr:ATP-grasp domain-containing protein [Candidatus Aenigmarchaeota archaeon]